MVMQQRAHFRKVRTLDSQNVYREYDHAAKSTFEKGKNFGQPKCKATRHNDHASNFKEYILETWELQTAKMSTENMIMQQRVQF